jgi:hypothetical protein
MRNVDEPIGHLLADAHVHDRDMWGRALTALNGLKYVFDIGSDVMSTPLSDLLRRLIVARANLPNRSASMLSGGTEASPFARFDAAILPLWQMQRDMEIQLPGDDQQPPSAYDVLLTDLAPEDLHEAVSSVLGVPYLSASPTESTWPVLGRIYGLKRRVLFTMPVSVLGGKCVNTHFIFDTGAPATYLALSTVAALGIEEWQLGDVAIRINGDQTSAVLISDRQVVRHDDGTITKCQFHGLNLMGMDFIERAKATFSVDMANKVAKISLPIVD